MDVFALFSLSRTRVGTSGKIVWKVSSVLKIPESLDIALNFEYLEILSGYFLDNFYFDFYRNILYI